MEVTFSPPAESFTSIAFTGWFLNFRSGYFENWGLMKLFIVALSLFFSMSVYSSQFPRVDTALAHYDAEVIKDNAQFNLMHANLHDSHWVTLKLSHMVFVDQYMRNFISVPKSEKWNSDEIAYFWQKFIPRWQSLDRANTADMKALLAIHTWIKISKFGDAADRDAWLLVQHADLDLPFQKSVLAVLETLYPKDETLPKNYAMLFDRVAVNSKQPNQKYGSQGMCKGTYWEPYPIEDFEHVEKRRAEMGMESFEKNKVRLDKICATFPG